MGAVRGGGAGGRDHTDKVLFGRDEEEVRMSGASSGTPHTAKHDSEPPSSF